MSQHACRGEKKTAGRAHPPWCRRNPSPYTCWRDHLVKNSFGIDLRSPRHRRPPHAPTHSTPKSTPLKCKTNQVLHDWLMDWISLD